MNTLRYINTNHAHYHFGKESCNALPVFHVLTNYGFGPSLNWIGKIRPIQLIENMKVFNWCFPK